MKLKSTLIWFVICFTVMYLGALFTASSVGTWYQSLIKPPGNPPDYVFGPVWFILFISMAVSAGNLSFSKSNLIFPYSLFSLQLLLNALWSFLFFYLQNPFFAFIEIIAFWCVLGITILVFYSYKKSAAYLLIPYFLWVSYAVYLNFGILTLNSN